MPRPEVDEAPLSANVHTSLEAVESLCEEWDALLDRSRGRSIFQTSGWLMSSFRHVEEPSTRLCVVTVRDARERLVGLGPFCVRRDGGWGSRTLEFLGTRFVSSEYLDVIAEPGLEERVVSVLWQEVERTASGWDFIRLSDLLDSSLVLTSLRDVIGRGRYRSEVRPAQVCPFMALPESGDALLAALGPNVRTALRRGKRKMERHGITVRMDASPESLREGLERLYELHGRRWTERGQRGNLWSESVRSFHRDVADRLGARDLVRVYTLEYGGRPLAAIYCLHYKETCFFFQSGLDTEPPNASIGEGIYSPGQWVMFASMEDAIRRGLHEYDFLRGVEPYKARWTQSSRTTWKFTVVPTDRWRGQLHHNWESAVIRLKDAVRSARGGSGALRSPRVGSDTPSPSED